MPPCRQPTHSTVLSTGLCPCKVHPNPGTHFTVYPRYFGSLCFSSSLLIQIAQKDCDLSLVHQLCHDLFLRLTQQPSWWIGFITNRSCPVQFFCFGFHFPGLAFTVVPSKICATSLLGSSQMGFDPPSPTDLHDLGTYLVFAPPNAGLHSSV